MLLQVWCSLLLLYLKSFTSGSSRVSLYLATFLKNVCRFSFWLSSKLGKKGKFLIPVLQVEPRQAGRRAAHMRRGPAPPALRIRIPYWKCGCCLKDNCWSRSRQDSTSPHVAKPSYHFWVAFSLIHWFPWFLHRFDFLGMMILTAFAWFFFKVPVEGWAWELPTTPFYCHHSCKNNETVSPCTIIYIIYNMYDMCIYIYLSIFTYVIVYLFNTKYWTVFWDM